MRCELREVVLRSKPAQLLAASPKGTVPVLVLPGGEVIDESLDIMLWALRRSDPQRWLVPQHGAMADMLALIAANDGAFKKSLDRYKYPNRYEQESAGDTSTFANAHRAAGARWLAGLEPLLERGWLFGSRPGLADMALLPFVRQFAHTDATWFAEQPWPGLLQWLQRWESSGLYSQIMKKYPAFQSEQPPPTT
jgi:glutathione S-transferase